MALIQGIPGEFEPQPWGEAILRSRELLLLRIVPQDTVTANADGVWDLAPVGPTAHLVARRAADVAVRFVGMVAPDSQHQIRLAGRRYGVTGHQLTRTTIGPFPMPDNRVVPLAVPAGIRRVLVAPVGTVLASIHPGRAEVTVVVTNFGRTTVRGEVELPLPVGWSAAEQTWMFDGLEPGRSIGWVTRVTGAGTGELHARLDAGRRSASSPYVVHL